MAHDLTLYEQMPTGVDTEPVLVVRPLSAIQAVWSELNNQRLLPQPWQLGGRFGSRIRSVPPPDDQPDAAAVSTGAPVPTRGIPLPRRLVDHQTGRHASSVVPNTSPSSTRRLELPSSCAGLVVRWLPPLPSHRAPKPEPPGHHDVHPERRSVHATRWCREVAAAILSSSSTGSRAGDGVVPQNLLASVLLPRVATHQHSTSAAAGVSPPPSAAASFTFCELFAGIGGFRLALEALGGRCVFASEINAECVETYRRLFTHGDDDDRQHHQTADMHQGDIRAVDAHRDIPDHDILVGGFPCQPFSGAGLQPGLDDASKGHLFQEIVRILRVKRPRAFLLENVPGLMGCDGGKTFDIVRTAFELDGAYEVTCECVNAKGVTVQNRNRLYFVGLLRQPRGDDGDAAAVGNNKTTTGDGGGGAAFQFPWIPDLRMCFGDVRERGAAAAAADDDDDAVPLVSEYTLTSDQLDKLLASRTWQARGANGRLAWHSKKTDTLISNYGQCVGNGDSMTVPRSWPHNPRCFTVRECARIMGIPDWFYFGDGLRRPWLTKSQRENPAGASYSVARVWIKTHYRMLGNAVCPGVIAVLASAILDALQVALSTNIATPMATMMMEAEAAMQHNQQQPDKKHREEEDVVATTPAAVAADQEGAVSWVDVGRAVAIAFACGTVDECRWPAFVDALQSSGMETSK